MPNRNIEPNGEVNSEVITYTLTPEELEEVRERTKHLNKYNRKTMVDVRVKTRRKK